MYGLYDSVPACDYVIYHYSPTARYSEKSSSFLKSVMKFYGVTI